MRAKQLILHAIAAALAVGAGPATRADPPSLAWELWRLDGLKVAEMNRLQAIVKDNSAKDPERSFALHQIAALATIESVRFLERLYDDLPDGTGLKPGVITGPWSKRELTEWLAQTGIPEAVPQLMIASWDPTHGPDHRWIAAEGLAEIQGVKAIPRLREMLKDKDPTVRAEVRRQLARLGDEETVRQLIEELGGDDDEKVRRALFDLSLCEGTNVKDALHRLFVSTPADKGRRALELKLLAGDASLRMGNKNSVAPMIELAALTRKQLRDLEIIRTPAQSLTICTHQEFGTDVEAWRRWWKDNAAAFEPFQSPDPRERLEIARAILDWARDQKSGPYITELPIYVARDRHDPGLASEAVRLYSPLEIELLGKKGYSLTISSSNGASAIAWLCALDPDRRILDIKLRTKRGQWIVDTATPARGGID